MNSLYRDIIKIENLKIFARHGVYPEETAKGQNFYVNASMYVKTREAGLEDNLELATDYGKVCHFIHNFMTENTYKLIEAAAENLAAAILSAFSDVNELELEIRKPDAPIGLPLESVSVKITRGWHTAFISLGSNMGDRQRYINNAIDALNNDALIRVAKASEIFCTKPYGEAAKNEFLNGAVKIKTLYTPEELLHCLHRIEAANGRERIEHWGDRTLDLDIIFYDDIIMSTEELIIPHPDMTNRDFVLVPLTQIDPYAVHPVYHEAVVILLDRLLKTKEQFII